MTARKQTCKNWNRNENTTLAGCSGSAIVTVFLTDTAEVGTPAGSTDRLGSDVVAADVWTVGLSSGAGTDVAAKLAEGVGAGCTQLSDGAFPCDEQIGKSSKMLVTCPVSGQQRPQTMHKFRK